MGLTEDPGVAKRRLNVIAGVILLAAGFVVAGVATFDQWSVLVRGLLGVG